MQGRRFTLEVFGSDTMDSVKAKIHSQTDRVMSQFGNDLGIKPELQRLKCNGIALRIGTFTVDDYAIPPGGIIKLRWSVLDYQLTQPM